MADGKETPIYEKLKNAAAGSMTTAKAVLIFYPLKEGVAVIDQDQKEDPYTVFFQFNPASLTIEVDSDDAEPVVNVVSTPDNQAGGGQQGSQESGNPVEYGPVNAAVTVSFKVIFDALINQRAFLSDAVNPSPTNAGRQIANLASSQSYTVRPIVEFFLAASRNIGTRRVEFRWGKMTYAGYLKKADCCYKMFDIKGEPVRVEIDLALSCVGCDACNNKKPWRVRYADFMEREEALSSFSPSNHLWRSAFVGATGLGEVEKACIRFHRAFLPENRDQVAVGTPAAIGLTPERSEDVYVKVHYNPASISMKSEAAKEETDQGGTTDPSTGGNSQPKVTPMKTELSMELIFDETENIDAFMADSGMGSPTGLGRAGWHLKEKMKGREYSVAPISELFVAAAMSSYARQVCFFWNGMEFAGELSAVNVEYTMFNNRGNPIRSQVTVSICKSGRTERDDDFKNIWKDVLNGNSGKREWAENQEFLEESQNLAQNKGLTASSENYIVSNLFRM